MPDTMWTKRVWENIMTNGLPWLDARAPEWEFRMLDQHKMLHRFTLSQDSISTSHLLVYAMKGSLSQLRGYLQSDAVVSPLRESGVLTLGDALRLFGLSHDAALSHGFRCEYNLAYSQKLAREDALQSMWRNVLITRLGIQIQEPGTVIPFRRRDE